MNSMASSYAHNNQGSNRYTGSTSGFTFKKRFERVDWKKIASVDVDSISRNLDFNALQDNIVNVTFCNIESEIDTRMADPNLIKLFRLAQLTIEYLLHSQDYLSTMVGALETQLNKAVTDQEQTQKAQNDAKELLSQVKKESHKRKKLLLAQQQIIQAGVNSYNKCQYCSKAFMNSSFLQSHLQRRHPEYSSQVQAAVIQMEPAVATSDPTPASPMVDQSKALAESKVELEQQLREIRERLQMTESQLVEERNARNKLSAKEKRVENHYNEKLQGDMEKWQEKQQIQHQKQMSEMQEALMRELNEMNEKYQASQNVLEMLHKKQARQSNLGVMQDELEQQQDLLERQREEASMIREQLQHQMEQKLQDKTVAQEKKWQKKMQNAKKQHRREMEQKTGVLKTAIEQLQKESVEEPVSNVNIPHQDDIMEISREESEPDSEEAQDREAMERQQKAVIEETVRKTGVGAMYDDSEEETENTHNITEPTDTRDTTEFEGTSTYTTTRGTMSMGQFGEGTLSMTEPPSERLLLEMRKNPNLLKILKEELLGILDQELYKRGIPQNAISVTDAVYNNKIQLLKAERQQLANKYRNIYDIRQQYLNTIEQQAKEMLKSREQATHSLNKPQRKSDGASSGPPRPTSAPGTRPTPTAPCLDPAPAPNPKSALKHAPVPAPRATSPTSRPGGSKAQGLLRSSVGSSMATTTGSITWDDDFDDDDSDSADAQTEKSPAHHEYTTQKPVKATRFADQQPAAESEDESNWDDLSDMDTLEPTLPGRQSRAQPVTSSTPQPKGEKVAQLSRSIELQLSGRGRKPAGGVNVMSTHNGSKPTAAVEEDDSFPSVSSVDEDKQGTATPGNRTHGSRGTLITHSSAADTEYSTNTYGTSLWGSSKGGSPAGQPTTPHNTSAKTYADSDVWDSDDLGDD